MLDELIARHGEAAILTVRPYIIDSGEILHWVLELDGKEPTDLDVRIDQGDPWVVMLLVRGDEEIEIGRWSRKRYPDGAQVVSTLEDLRRSERFGGP